MHRHRCRAAPALAGWTAAPDPEAKVLPIGKPVLLEPGEAKATAMLQIEKPGVYGIALGDAGWIDVVPEGGSAALEPVAHGHGPACSSIRKIVRFRLEAGPYRVEVSRMTAPQTRAMLVEGE